MCFTSPALKNCNLIPRKNRTDFVRRGFSISHHHSLSYQAHIRNKKKYALS